VGSSPTGPTDVGVRFPMDVLRGHSANENTLLLQTGGKGSTCAKIKSVHHGMLTPIENILIQRFMV
jgi:hypothetical protein